MYLESFHGFYGVPRYMKPGETVRIGFSVYNGNPYDITVKVTVYQKEPSLKKIGETSFKAYAKSFTRFTSLLEFTMPNTKKAVLHAEAVVIYPNGAKNNYGADWTVYRKEEPPIEPPKDPKPPIKPPKDPKPPIKPPKDPKPPTTDLKQLAIEAVKQKYGSDTSVKQVNQYSNYYVMDVTKYMKQLNRYTADITAAWLLIKLDPISINAISSPDGIPTYSADTWIEGKKYEVVNINGEWYAVALPANFLIYWNTNKYRYYKATTDICSAVKYLRLAGYSVTISECSGSTGSGDSGSGDTGNSGSTGSSGSTGDTSTAPSEPKDDKKSYLLLAGGGAAILLLVLLLMEEITVAREKMYMWILILVGAYIIYKFVIESGSTSTNTSTTSGSTSTNTSTTSGSKPDIEPKKPPSGSEPIYTPPYYKNGCIEIINPITKRKEIICPL